MAFMRPYTIPLSPMRSVKYERWTSRKTGISILRGLKNEGEYEFTLDLKDTPLTIINKQTDQPLSKHTATPLDVQVLGSEVLQLYIDDILLNRRLYGGSEKGDVVVGKPISSEIFYHIWRKSASGSKQSLSFETFVQKIKDFQKLKLALTRNENFFSEILRKLARYSNDEHESVVTL